MVRLFANTRNGASALGVMCLACARIGRVRDLRSGMRVTGEAGP